MAKQCDSCLYWAASWFHFGVCSVREDVTWDDDACDEWKEWKKTEGEEEVE
jgi:hypothetical protein